MKNLKITSLYLTLLFLGYTFNTQAQSPTSAKTAYDDYGSKRMLVDSKLGKIEDAYTALEKAKKAIDEAILNEKHNTKSKTWLYRGQIYTAVANEQAGSDKSWDENALITAQEAFKKAQELEPANKDIAKEVKDRFYPAALNTSIKFYNVGNKLQKEEKDAESTKAYQMSLKAAHICEQIAPQDTLAYILAISAAYPLKDFDAYKNATEKLIAIPEFKEKGSYIEYLAFYYRDNEKNSTKALELAKKGIDFDPDNSNLMGLMIELLDKENRVEEALAMLKTQVSKNPNDAKAHLNLGILYEKLKKPEDAFNSYQKSIDLDPNFDALYSAGAVVYNKGAEIMKVVNVMSADEYNKKGKAEEARASEELKKALPFFEKAYALNRSDIQLLGAMSNIYRILKMTDKQKKIDAEIKALGD
jgi:tetratricopeptide (TPR) repeat protein